MNAPAPIDFAALMPKVAPLLLGKPNERMSKGTRLRFGTNGSMEIDTGEGWFDDHEGKARGGVLALIQHKRRCNMREALSWLEEQGLKDKGQPQTRTPPVFYDYDDPDTGEIAFRVERRGKGMSPPFLQHGPDGRGGFHAARGCMAGVKRLPYRASALRAAPADAIVFVVEGEKDADRLVAAGLIATTNSGGAGKFGPELVPYFTDRRVVIIPDNDQPGQDHAADVAGKLAGTAKTVAILPLPGGPKSDVSDWLAQGGSEPELVQKAEAALASAVLKPPALLLPLLDPAAWANPCARRKPGRSRAGVAVMRGAPRHTRSRADLLRVRRRLRMTQSAFAERFGLSASWVQDVERGHGGDDRKTHLLLAAIEQAPEIMAKVAADVTRTLDDQA